MTILKNRGLSNLQAVNHLFPSPAKSVALTKVSSEADGRAHHTACFAALPFAHDTILDSLHHIPIAHFCLHLALPYLPPIARNQYRDIVECLPCPTAAPGHHIPTDTMAARALSKLNRDGSAMPKRYPRGILPPPSGSPKEGGGGKGGMIHPGNGGGGGGGGHGP
ncbi:hypothetical protein A4X13_0g5681 [Tilletia indica]|uniref:Uncharacterized protein n=1 Tax=Tilletia indica TaxID=43049 RepID=A0A8T8SRH2_9BASI|nr:hypothetical protein A4X13_0g5681 [Tilletia indica]